MPSSPAQPASPKTPRRAGQPGDGVRGSPSKSKPPLPSAPNRVHSHTPQGSPKPQDSTRPAAAPRRHTIDAARPRPSRPPPATAPKNASGHGTSRRRTTSTPAPARASASHVLIPVPIRAKDAESPVFVRAPSGQRVDFVFSPPKKRGLIGRLLDSVEWGDPQRDRPYRYRKPTLKSSSSRPFYKKLLS